MSIGVVCEIATTASERRDEQQVTDSHAGTEAEIMQCLREQRPLNEDQVSQIEWAFERRQVLESLVQTLKRERRINLGLPPDVDLADGADEDVERYIRLTARVERLLDNKRITQRWVDIIHGRTDITGPELKELVGFSDLQASPSILTSQARSPRVISSCLTRKRSSTQSRSQSRTTIIRWTSRRTGRRPLALNPGVSAEPWRCNNDTG